MDKSGPRPISEPAIERPTEPQRRAADPLLSAWVGANAGSGKTRVLTQRVARLLLAGADPGKILCLTYTKAAAAEMQSRLFSLLGGWAMRSEESLAEQLGALEGGPPVTDRQRLATARRLFARALETPGGLKIQTIHAFCEALLRRFPLEAGISPSFQILEDRQADRLIADLRQEMAADAERLGGGPFDRLASRLNEEALSDITHRILGKADAFTGAEAETRIAAHFGSDALRGPEEIAADLTAALARLDPAGFAAALGELGGKQEQKIAAALHELGEEAARDLDGFAPLLAAVLTTQGEVRKTGFPTKAVQKAGLQGRADALNDWALRALTEHATARAIARIRDLHNFGREIAARYARAKRARGFLDFNDLIQMSGTLLASEAGAWVLYKLDQGIDHVLVDEAQDTSPPQWAVIRAITSDFHSGDGRLPDAALDRTIFVVGDEKQSIYSFQGAEPQAFGGTRESYTRDLDGIGKRLDRPDLTTSFRSAPGILRFVDTVFAGERARGLTVEGSAIAHEAHRAKDASRVELWPLIEPVEAPEPPDWDSPVDMPLPEHPKNRLAALLATRIAEMLARDTLPIREGGRTRRIEPGDILILVRKRDRLARTLIRKLKSAGVPVAGADRLALSSELAVKDLVALMKAVLLPQDDLSLAAALRSPLFAISENQLFDLAHNRKGTLWRAVMEARERHPHAAAMLEDLARRVGFLSPYEFLERILVTHDGRRRLLARLGPEAEDPIDELLAQALGFEAREISSLSGFLAWIESADITLKREMDKAAGEVRVMTVHGAKGLEAPVVILPDTVTASAGGRSGPGFLDLPGTAEKPALTIWPGAKPEDDPLTRAARQAAETRAVEEADRLLYVGLTRAEDRLILCGAGQQSHAAESWYGKLRAAFASLPHRVEDDLTLGEVLICDDQAETPAEIAAPAAPDAKAAREKPAWFTEAMRERRPERLSPSRLVGDAGPETGGPGIVAADDAMEDPAHDPLLHGNAVHLLLDKLGGRAAEDWEQLAPRLLPGLEPAALRLAMEEAASVALAPEFAALFGPESLSEASLSLRLEGFPGFPMLGRADRLIVGEDRVTVIDFKTDRLPAALPGQIGKSYIAQLGAYREALAQIYPGRAVSAAILWTRTAALMEIPVPLLETVMAELREGIDLQGAAP